MTQQKVELRKGTGQAMDLPLTRLPPDQADAIALMVSASKNNKPIEGITALDINVGVMEIIDAAKKSIRTGRAVKLAAAK
jgi:predicted dehydrogenase